MEYAIIKKKNIIKLKPKLKPKHSEHNKMFIKYVIKKITCNVLFTCVRQLYLFITKSLLLDASYYFSIYSLLAIIAY